ncbi:MAG TPA: phage baseplate assembly protein V [Herpetosiphonaceae bacterium]
MEELLALIRQIAEREARRVHTTELGVVTAVFPHAEEGDNDNYQCSVTLKNRKLADGKDLELPRVPVATPYLGLAAIPNVGDLVLLSFIGGDINAPVITGRLYNDEQRPPPNQEGEFLLQHALAEGGSINIDAEGRIIITSKGGKNTVTIDDDQIALAGEKFSLLIDIKGEAITITSDKALTIEAKSGALALKGNEVTIEAKGNMKLKGAKIELN